MTDAPMIAAEDLRAAADDLLADMVALRRKIHLQPELGLDLPATQAAVLQAIDGLDLDVRTGVGCTSVVADLEGGLPGPTILLRGDMDALPMAEATDLPYASEVDGRMHACGHDAHVAMLVGAAHLLVPFREHLAGRIRFMFQPGEEGYWGARVMAEEGVLAGVGAAFAIHVSPDTPAGQVMARSGPLMASSDVVEVRVTGRGGHASSPHTAIDPVPVAAEVVLALQSMLTRRIDAFDPAVLSITMIRVGTASNVIADTVKMAGTLRCVSESTRRRAWEGIQRVADGIAAAHRCTAEVTITEGYPVTVNDAGMTTLAADCTRDVLGPDRWLDMSAPVMGAEDFSVLLQQVPGAMVFLGAKPPDLRHGAPCHSNRMQIDEPVMADGATLHAAVALRYLARYAP